MQRLSASSPQEMKSSTSQRAGISRTLRYTMYLTIGANVSTSRSRSFGLPVRLYSAHSAIVSAPESRLFLLVVVSWNSVLVSATPDCFSSLK